MTQVGTPVILVALQELQMRGFVVARSHGQDAQNVVGDPVQMVLDLTELLLDHGERTAVEMAAPHGPTAAAKAREAAWKQARSHAASDRIHPAHLAASIWDAVTDGPWQLVNRPIGDWVQRLWNFSADDRARVHVRGHGVGGPVGWRRAAIR